MLARDLRARLGSHHVFLDVDSLTPGKAFPEKLATTLSQVNAVLVVIGSRWLDRLTSVSKMEQDWVRVEIAESLRRPGLPVVPVCSLGVPFPAPNDLPAEIRDLAGEMAAAYAADAEVAVRILKRLRHGFVGSSALRLWNDPSHPLGRGDPDFRGQGR